MTDTIKVPIAELQGHALDWAVAKALPQFDVTIEPDGRQLVEHGTICLGHAGYDWSPSTDWAQGGPLIDRYRAAFEEEVTQYTAIVVGGFGCGKTHLIAAMRAIVAAEIGDTVAVPADLIARSNEDPTTMTTEISLPEPMARVVLELYAISYSEGQTPEEIEPLLRWIVENYPRLFDERDFQWLPKP